MQLKLNPSSRREGTAVVRTSYDYVPSVMLDGKYRMWWCGGKAGDYIYYSESKSLEGDWSEPRSVFAPTKNGENFDGLHVCDPSVIRVEGTYYMYYGGYPQEVFNAPTRIGVATSNDGITWERLNNGEPIVVPNGNIDTFVNKYGAGQPSAIFLDGLFYLIYTDTTGKARNPGNGAGQYVVRSSDPTFQNNVEELTQNGFVSRGSSYSTTTEYSLIEAFSVDWQFVDLLDSFLVVSHSELNVTYLNFFDRNLSKIIYSESIPDSPWTEGGGIVCRPDHHAVPSLTNPASVPIDVFRSVGSNDPNTWDLAYVGMDLETDIEQNQIPFNRIYEGSAIQSPELPLAVVINGKRLQFASAEPVSYLTRNYFNVSSSIYDSIPYGASMPLKARVIGASDRPAAFVLDDEKKWKVDCLEIITANQSFIETLSIDKYDAIPSATDLKCLR